jgi:carbamate kinase
VTRVVIALGGNALLRRGEEDTAENMRRSARFAAERIADIAAAGWEVVVTHGNGPQVGRILLQQEAARGFLEDATRALAGEAGTTIS